MIGRFAWQCLKRDWRTSETQWVLVSLLIAVASVVSIGVLNGQIQSALGQQEKRFLGADMVVRSAEVLPQAWLDEAEQRGLQIEQTVAFRSVMLAHERFRLVDVKAVGTDYPLRGAIRIATKTPMDAGVWHATGPDTGTVWIEPRLVGLLQVQIGDVIQIGVANLTIAGVILEEPGQASYLLAFAPRVLMHRDDLPRTQVVRPGSRVHYAYLLKGQDIAVEDFQQWLKPQLSSAQRIISRANASPALTTTLAKAEEFLALASVFSVFLAGLAVAIAANRYQLRHADTAALLSCLGAKPTVIIRVFVLQLCLLALISSILGGLLGYATAALLVWSLADWLPVSLTLTSLQPFFVGTLTAFVTLFGFALCTTFRLRSVPPTQVLRHVDTPNAGRIWVYVLTVLSVALLMWWLSGNGKSTLLLLGVCALVLLVSSVLVYALLQLGMRLLRWVPGSFRQAIRQVSGQMGSSMTQIISVGAAMMIILVVILVRVDLLADWQAGLPNDAHNHFLMNIQYDQATQVQTFLQQQGMMPSPMMPMIRGRLMAKNGVPIAQAVAPEAREHNALRRALNLSWSTEIPANNRLLRGEWWGSDVTKPVISVESTIAAELDLVVGDELRFQIADQSIEAEIISIRHVEWDSFKPNFYVLFPPDVLPSASVSYLTSFYLPKTRKHVLNTLVTEFPTLTLIEVDALMNAVRDILAQVTNAMGYLALFILAASLCVLTVALQATLEGRMLNAAIMRALGASRAFIRRMLYAEWVVLGLVSGGLAAAGAELCAWFLYREVFQLSPHWHVWLWWVGPGCGVILVVLMSTRVVTQVLNQPPLDILRRA